MRSRLVGRTSAPRAIAEAARPSSWHSAATPSLWKVADRGRPVTPAPRSLDERITAILASAGQPIPFMNCDPKFASAPPRSSSGSVHSATTSASSKPTVVIVAPAPERPWIQGSQFRFPFPTSLQRAGKGTRRGSFCATASLHGLASFWTELPWFGPSGSFLHPGRTSRSLPCRVAVKTGPLGPPKAWS